MCGTCSAVREFAEWASSVFSVCGTCSVVESLLSKLAVSSLCGTCSVGREFAK